MRWNEHGNRGESSVIGSILLVAVVIVVTSMVGGTLVGNVADDAEAPSATVEMTFDGKEVELAYTGPDSADGANLHTEVSSGSLSGSDWSGTVEPGTIITLTHDTAWSGETVRVVWESDSGGASEVVASETAPS